MKALIYYQHFAQRKHFLTTYENKSNKKLKIFLKMDWYRFVVKAA